MSQAVRLRCRSSSSPEAARTSPIGSPTRRAVAMPCAARDMAREYRVITAVGPTTVPVPRTFGLCEDGEVNGQPFYVMEFVDGHIIRDARAAQTDLDEAGRRRAGHSLA